MYAFTIQEEKEKKQMFVKLQTLRLLQSQI